MSLADRIDGRHGGEASIAHGTTVAAAPDVTFRPDFAGLRRHGMITPRSLGGVLGREIAAIRRQLLRRLQFFTVAPSPGERRGKVVLVSSPEPGDGKTFFCLNLAFSLVLEDRIGVTLIDADLQRPKLAKLLGLDHRRGLADCLRADAGTVAPPLVHAEGLPLSVLPSGRPGAGAMTALEGPAMAETVREIGRRHPDRIVLIDGPPLLAATEAAALAEHAQEIVLVVGGERTTTEVLAGALDLLHDESRVSLVLNRCPVASGAKHYGTYKRAAEGDGPA